MSRDTNRQNIVVGFDDTPQAHAALHWAAAEAKSRGAHLRIVIVWDPSPVTPWNLPALAEWRERAQTDAQQAAEAASDAVGGGLDVEALAIEGQPGKVLADESSYADLIVVGSAGHVGLAGLLTGSVSPLVVLGPRAQSDPTRRLLLSSTLDPEGETFEWVARWVERRAVPIYVVASFDITSEIADLTLSPANHDIGAAVREQNERWIESLRRVVAPRAVVLLDIDRAVVEGPVRSVLDRLSEPGDLLVVPAGCERYVPVARGECPIAVVPAARQGAKETAPAPEHATTRSVVAAATSTVATATSAVR